MPASAERRGVFRRRAREDSRGAGRACHARNFRADDRHRGRRRVRRAGAGDSRHVGNQQGLLAAVPAPLRRPAYGDDRCRVAVCRRREVGGLSQREGAVLAPASPRPGTAVRRVPQYGPPRLQFVAAGAVREEGGCGGVIPASPPACRRTPRSRRRTGRRCALRGR